MNDANTALALFVLVVAVNVVGLLLDYWLAMNGLTTVTEVAHYNNWVAVVIVVWQFLGALAIAIHFREYRP